MYEELNSKVVRVDVAPGREIIARRGAMLGYEGDVRFRPLSGGGGAGGMIGRQLSGEATAMMLAEGTGRILYGFAGMHLTRIRLDGTAALTAESSRVLCHDASLQVSVVPVAGGGGGGGGGLGGMLRGAARGALTGQGLMTSQLSGHGEVVLLSHGGTIELPVSSGEVVVDPQAYVGHRGPLTIDLRAALSWRDAVGRGSGEAMQLTVRGQGSVLVQASEERL